jgi:hypothetical protein
MSEVLETIMLICFGISWPISIMKLIKVKQASGKSKFFLGLIFFGYLAGIANKFLYDTTHSPIVWLYVLNACMVFVDLLLTIRYASPAAPETEVVFLETPEGD